MYRAGRFDMPAQDDPEFEHQHQAEEYARKKSNDERGAAYAVWDERDNTLVLFFEYEVFELRK